VRIVNCIAWVAWAAVLLSAPGVSQSAEKQDAPKEMEMFATNRYFSKGGIGMINKHLYAVVKSASGDSNELIVKPVEDKEERWKVRSRPRRRRFFSMTEGSGRHGIFLIDLT